MRPPVHASSLLAALIAAGILCICSRSHRCGLETLTPRALGKRAAQAVLGLGLLAPLDPQAMRCALADTASARVQEGRVFEEVWKNVNDNFFDDTYNKNDWQALHEDYSGRIRQGADERKLTEKALSLLGDKYTRLLDKKVFEGLWEYDAIGVGILFQSDPGQPLVVAAPPISGSSGEAAGIRKGDIIHSINGVNTEKTSAMQVLDMLSNDDKSTLELEYSPAESAPGAPHKMVVLKRSTQRAENPVSYRAERVKSYDNKLVGYISLKEFNSLAVPGVKEAVLALEKMDVDVLLLDLRGNTGGGFQFALNIGGIFMDGKSMVTTAGRGSEGGVFKSSYPDGVLTQKPLVLLVDGLSASASEVLAGGLQDNCRAVLAGTKTFGKGKIQAVFGLADGEGLTMTVAQYVTPRGTVIQSRGLVPRVAIRGQADAYVNYLAGSRLPKLDLASIDLAGAEEQLKACQPM